MGQVLLKPVDLSTNRILRGLGIRFFDEKGEEMHSPAHDLISVYADGHWHIKNAKTRQEVGSDLKAGMVLDIMSTMDLRIGKLSNNKRMEVRVDINPEVYKQYFASANVIPGSIRAGMETSSMVRVTLLRDMKKSTLVKAFGNLFSFTVYNDKI